jgi:hypothetical protein
MGMRFAAWKVFNGIMDAGGLTRRAVVIKLVNGRSSSDNFELCSKVNVVLSLLRMVIRVLDVVVLGNRSARSFRLWG